MEEDKKLYEKNRIFDNQYINIGKKHFNEKT